MHVQERDCFQMETQANTMLRPIAAFSAGEASQYPYFAATSKSCCIVSGVGQLQADLEQTAWQVRGKTSTAPIWSPKHHGLRDLIGSAESAKRTVLGIIFLRSCPAREEANSSLRSDVASPLCRKSMAARGTRYWPDNKTDRTEQLNR